MNSSFISSQLAHLDARKKIRRKSYFFHKLNDISIQKFYPNFQTRKRLTFILSLELFSFSLLACTFLYFNFHKKIFQCTLVERCAHWTRNILFAPKALPHLTVSLIASSFFSFSSLSYIVPPYLFTIYPKYLVRVVYFHRI